MENKKKLILILKLVDMAIFFLRGGKMKNTFKGYTLNKDGDIEGSIPTLMSTYPIFKKVQQINKDVEEYVMSELVKLDIDPNVLEKQLAEIDMLKRQIEILKQIILDELNVVGEFCSLCQKKGQYLPTCDCMENKECLENLIKLYGEKK